MNELFLKKKKKKEVEIVNTSNKLYVSFQMIKSRICINVAGFFTIYRMQIQYDIQSLEFGLIRHYDNAIIGVV